MPPIMRGSLPPVDDSHGQKLYIETHGCQMNEYDSSRMVDLLGEHRPGSHRPRRRCRRDPAQYLLDPRTGPGPRVLATGPLARRTGQPGHGDRRRRLRGQPEGAAIRDRAPYVDVVFGPQTLHRLPEMIDAARSPGCCPGRRLVPEIEKFDRLPEPHRRGRAPMSVMKSCSKYCTFCVVPHPAKRSAGRLTMCCPSPPAGWRARSDPPGPERQRLSRPDPRWPPGGPGGTDPRGRRRRWHRAHSLPPRTRWSFPTA